MHKILITTSRSVVLSGHPAVSVHTVAVEFSSREAAQFAIDRVNGSSNVGYDQKAILLY